MSLTWLVNYCVCKKNGRKPPFALTGSISSQILITFIEAQICINLWRDDQQDCFFFSKDVAPSVFVDRVVSLPWRNSRQIVGVPIEAVASHRE